MTEQILDSTRRTLVTIAVMLAVLIQVLDTTIANVALPHMQASLGATQESINWVLTSYIVASAIAILDSYARSNHKQIEAVSGGGPGKFRTS